jgi:hypothetical protein
MPIFRPVVKVLERASSQTVQFAEVKNGSDFERCFTAKDGTCRLLVAARRAGAKYQIDASLTGFRPAKAEVDPGDLQAGNPIEIVLEAEVPPITFDVVRGGRGVPGVKVTPNCTGVVRSDHCYLAGTTGPSCASVLSPDGKSTFYFWPRPTDLALLVEFPDGTPQVSAAVHVPPDKTTVQVPVDPPPPPSPVRDGGVSAATCRASASATVPSLLPKNGPLPGAPPSNELQVKIVDGVVKSVIAKNSTFQTSAEAALVGKPVSEGSCEIKYPWTP